MIATAPPRAPATRTSTAPTSTAPTSTAPTSTTPTSEKTPSRRDPVTASRVADVLAGLSVDPGTPEDWPLQLAEVGAIQLGVLEAMLAGRSGLEVGEAFEVVRRQARGSGRPLREIAQAVLTRGASTDGSSTGPRP